jgi:hypothetical protein
MLPVIISRNKFKQRRFRNIDTGSGAHNPTDKNFTSDPGYLGPRPSLCAGFHAKLYRSISQKYPLPCTQRLEQFGVAHRQPAAVRIISIRLYRSALFYKRNYSAFYQSAAVIGQIAKTKLWTRQIDKNSYRLPCFTCRPANLFDASRMRDVITM